MSQAQGLAIWRELIKRLVLSIMSGFDRTNYFEGLAMAQWHGYLTLITTLTGYLRAQASSNHYSLVRPSFV